MQAIILAAGMGKRLGELTQNNTKCMVEVNGVKLIDRVILQLSRLHLSRLIIVVGYEGIKLIDYIGHRYDDILKIEYVDNPIYDKTNNIYSLSLAKDKFSEDDTLLLESDLIFEDGMLDLLIKHPNPDLALIAKYETWMDGTMVCIDEERNIVNFISKQAFRYEDVSTYYKTVNIYKFSREFINNEYLPFLDAYKQVMGNNEYYEQVLRVLTMTHDCSLKALPISNEKWYEIDDVQDLDIASCLFSDNEKKYQEYHRRYGGFWRFPKLMDYCYLVNPFFPNERLKDELRANFNTLLTQYPSGMYVNSLLAGKYFGIRQDYIAVGNGAAELIKCIMEEYIDSRIGIIYPTFDEYPNRLCPERIVPYIPKNKDFSYTADDLMNYYCDKDISLLLFINPDNPSGNYIQKNDVLRLSAWCAKQRINLIVDESFVDFTFGYTDNSLLNNNILSRYPTMIVIKSISKSYGVPGLRLGVLATANTELVTRVKRKVSIWNINSFAEFYLQIYGKYRNDYDKACMQFILEREIFYKELMQISYLRIIPSQANYFLCEVVGKYTSVELTQRLIEYDVIVSNCGLKAHIEGHNLIRLAIRSREENAKLIEILKIL